MLLILSWKNIWRNKKRSLIILAAMIFGLWGGLMAGALMMGMGESIVNSAIDRDLAHIQIHHTVYPAEERDYEYHSQRIGHHGPTPKYWRRASGFRSNLDRRYGSLAGLKFWSNDCGHHPG